MTTLLLLKFGIKANIEALYNEGHIYMDFLDNFKKNDYNKEKFDVLEGTATNIYVENGLLELKLPEDNKWKHLAISDAHFNQYIDTSKFYSYHLYAVTNEDLKSVSQYKLDLRMKKFGERFVMINNPKTFLERIKEYLRINQYEFEIRHVKYYDDKLNQNKLTPFHKSQRLKHQKELRILVKAKSNEPLQFKIGSLEQCSSIYDSEMIDSMLLRLS